MNKSVTIHTESVLEPRALAELVGLANEYKSSIYISMDDKRINAKSIMGIMGLGMDKGKEIMLCAEGEDEQSAIAAIEKFLL